MKTVIAALIVLVILAVGAVALTNKNKSAAPPTTQNTTATNTSQAPTAGSINIKNLMFTPSQISVAKGGTVTWTNNDKETHTVTDDLSNVGGPNSGNIAPGATYSFTFTKTGSFQYHCAIHPSMRGTIVVK